MDQPSTLELRELADPHEMRVCWRMNGFQLELCNVARFRGWRVSDSNHQEIYATPARRALWLDLFLHPV